MNGSFGLGAIEGIPGLDGFVGLVSISGLVDIAIAFTLIECAALALYHRATGHGLTPRDFIAGMASGLCLMFALRSYAHDAGPAWVASFVLAAGLAHGIDIGLRWRRGASAASTHRRVTL